MSSGDWINERATQSRPRSIPNFTFFLSEIVNAELFRTVSGKLIPFLLLITPSKITLL